MADPGLGECFSLSGWFKILESIAVFVCLMLHRIGNKGRQIFYGASDEKLDARDQNYPTEVDAEILGAGAVMAFAVITPMVLLAYVTEGRKAVQSTSLDSLFCFAAAATFIASGSMCCFAWNHANENVGSLTRRDLEFAGALGVTTIATGIIYLADFFWVVYQKAVIGERDYY